MQACRLAEPTTLDEAVGLLADDPSTGRVLAGGTALVPLLRQGVADHDLFIALHRIPLAYVRRDGAGGLSIGAMTRLSALERSPEVVGAAHVLAAAAGCVGNLRVRHQATLGGNLAHADPHADPPVALLVLDASVHLVSRRGARDVRLGEFLRGPYETAAATDEILEEVRIPAGRPPTGMTYERVTARTHDDWPCVTAAVAVWVEHGVCVDARIAVGAAGPMAARLPVAEAVCRDRSIGEAWSRAAADVAAEVAEAHDDAFGRAGYKRALIRATVRRALEQACV